MSTMRNHSLTKRVQGLLRAGHGRETAPVCPGCEKVIRPYERKVYIHGTAWHRHCAFPPRR